MTWQAIGTKSKSSLNSVNTRRRKSLQRRLERHFLTCSAAAGAVAALAPAQEAQATIHYFDPADIQIPLNNFYGIYFNLETGDYGATAGAVPGWDLNIFNPNTTYLFTFAPGTTGIIGYTNGAYSYSDRLNAGDIIGPAGSFLYGGVNTMSAQGVFGPWAGTLDGFLGLQFTLADSSTVFGWVHVNVTGSVSAQVTDWAWEDNGGQIAANAVPEPSSLALSFLAAGAAGLAYWRRRKAQTA